KGNDHLRGDILRMFVQGYKQGGIIGRLIGGSIVTFEVFCPKAFACVDGLIPGTALFDRSITIFMQPGNTPQFYKEKEAIRTGELQTRLADYAVQNEVKLLQIQETSDKRWSELIRRERELWLPLLFHACLAGP